MQKRNHFNKTLADKLGLVKDEIRTQNTIPAINQSGIDGVHHINVWEHGDTELGVGLAHMSKTPFVHPEFGPFNSIEGFWQWLRDASHDDRHRTTSGWNAKAYGKNKTVKFVNNFQYQIMMANWYKVQSYEYFIDEIGKSELPFEMYYIYKSDNPVKVRPSPAYWLISGFEEIRLAIKEDRLPNFDFLIHNREDESVVKRSDHIKQNPVAPALKLEIRERSKPALTDKRKKYRPRPENDERRATIEQDIERIHQEHFNRMPAMEMDLDKIDEIAAAKANEQMVKVFGDAVVETVDEEQDFFNHKPQ